MGTESIGIEKQNLKFSVYVKRDDLIPLIHRYINMDTDDDSWFITSGSMLKQDFIDLYIYLVEQSGCSNFLLKWRDIYLNNVIIWLEIWEII